jgi:hypothetical protein
VDSYEIEPPTAGERRMLDQARANRASVRTAATTVEGALAMATNPDPVGWGQRVAAAVAELTAAFSRHARANEAPGGLLSEIVARAPWLAHGTDRLRRDHAEILARLGALAQDASSVTDAAAGAAVRTAGLRLLQHLSEHRHLGVDLVQDAYLVDIEAAD